MEDCLKVKEEPMDESCPETSGAFNALIGSKTGILKGLKPGKDGLVQKSFPVTTKYSKDNAITTLAWRNDYKTEALVGHANKSVSLFDCESGSYIFRISVQVGEGKVVGIVKRAENIFVGVESGHISPLFKAEKDGSMLQVPISTVKYKRSDVLKEKPNLSALKADPFIDTRIATGGCENDLKIWDVKQEQRLVFVARNVPHDMLDLRVPVWVSDLAYLPDDRTVAVVSRHNCVRLYDPRAKRRPVLNTNYEESPITCLTTIPDKDRYVAIGTAHGRVTLYDLRFKSHNRAPVVFKHINGAIKGLACPVEDPSKIYSASLDRYFRIHDLETKKTVTKEYMKSQLTSVLV